MLSFIKYTLITAHWCLALVAFQVGALSLGPPKIKEAFADSDIVVLATINKQEKHFVDGIECGTVYTASTIKILKAPRGQSSVISFGRFSGLQNGRQYLLFLRYVNDFEPIRNELSKRSDIESHAENLDNLIACNGVTPGYHANPYIAWRLHGADLIIGVLPSDWPSRKTIKTLYVDGRQFKGLPRQEVLRFLTNKNKIENKKDN